jgi:hypothetical protein
MVNSLALAHPAFHPLSLALPQITVSADGYDFDNLNALGPGRNARPRQLTAHPFVGPRRTVLVLNDQLCRLSVRGALPHLRANGTSADRQ